MQDMPTGPRRCSKGVPDVHGNEIPAENANSVGMRQKLSHRSVNGNSNDHGMGNILIRTYRKGKGKEVYLYSALSVVPHTQGAQAWITQCYLQLHQCLPLPRKRSPDGASPD